MTHAARPISSGHSMPTRIESLDQIMPARSAHSRRAQQVGVAIGATRVAILVSEKVRPQLLRHVAKSRLMPMLPRPATPIASLLVCSGVTACYTL